MILFLMHIKYKLIVLIKMREKIILQHFSSHAMKSKESVESIFRLMYCISFLSEIHLWHRPTEPSTLFPFRGGNPH